MVKYDVPGAEDLAISRQDSFLIISSDDRAARRDGRVPSGGIYKMDLRDTMAMPVLLRAPDDVRLFPHGISMISLSGGRYRLLVINHVSDSDEALGSADLETVHSVEEYILDDSTYRHIHTYEDETMLSPNDVVAIDDTRYYFTNDHGSTTRLGLLAEDYLGLRRSNVVYFDGAQYRVVAEGIAYANGIAFDKRHQYLYVASPRDFLVKVYSVLASGDLEHVIDISCGSGVDNIELDEEGHLWIGCHPDLLHFAAYASGQKSASPSEILKIMKGEGESWTVHSVYLDDGQIMSAATTAVPFGSELYVGNVMDDHFIKINRSDIDEKR